MESHLEGQPFKNREHVIAEVRKCVLFGDICQYTCFVFAALEVVGDALDITLGLEPTSWFLLAIVAGLSAIIDHSHAVVTKHLLWIESDSKKANY